ncbi:hypothetical protein [Phenylobacterium sp. 58.2.17]|uniref:hypothetical protein n=1 Tax=Phenylobacterium sp. 58.2.17 TaxID=2969306 RepID=UPI002263B826|nr:hypothetical protein [Phenylobacterium sp. 58.2.17]MCX7588667.1 hypothetical protein [Phenylobacterium sp. 58.2.17]
MKPAAAVLAAALATSAAADEFPVRLDDGATWTMTVDHTIETDRAGVKEIVGTTTTSQLVWAPGVVTVRQVSIGGREGVPDEAVQALNLGVPVELTVDEALQPTGIRNEAQVRDAVAAMLKRTTPNSPDPAAVGPGKAAIFKGMVEELAMRDVRRTSISQGMSLKPGKATAYEGSLQSPFGGSPMTATGSYTLITRDRAANRAVIHWRQAIDPKSAQRGVADIATASFDGLTDKQAEALRESVAKLAFDQHEECRHEIDIATGLALNVQCSSTVVADNITRVERWTITQTQPQTPAKTD